MGVKIYANNLETALAGSPVFKYETEEELAHFKEILNKDIKKIKKNVKLKPIGVGVAASTLGSLEALLVYLKHMKIDVSSICIGDVTKNDLLKVLTPFS
jgi:translation initiation factor IF-2